MTSVALLNVAAKLKSNWDTRRVQFVPPTLYHFPKNGSGVASWPSAGHSHLSINVNKKATFIFGLVNEYIGVSWIFITTLRPSGIMWFLILHCVIWNVIFALRLIQCWTEWITQTTPSLSLPHHLPMSLSHWIQWTRCTLEVFSMIMPSQDNVLMTLMEVIIVNTNIHMRRVNAWFKYDRSMRQNTTLAQWQLTSW